MQFGSSLHTCFGQQVNRVRIPGILKRLLRKQNEERAVALTDEGPFPSSLAVRFR
ncbi:MAG TPA: hypothetical protein VKT81_04645 [Bryobacteraceae bacterium]|nr:hypothetical protein [Bryobacteraceae bacterium]